MAESALDTYFQDADTARYRAQRTVLKRQGCQAFQGHLGFDASLLSASILQKNSAERRSRRRRVP